MQNRGHVSERRSLQRLRLTTPSNRRPQRAIVLSYWSEAAMLAQGERFVNGRLYRPARSSRRRRHVEASASAPCAAPSWGCSGWSGPPCSRSPFLERSGVYPVAAGKACSPVAAEGACLFAGRGGLAGVV